MPSRRAVGLLLLAAFILRLASNSWLTDPEPLLAGDALWYHSSAVSLAAGEGYVHHFTRQPTAAWPPGYPAMLAVLYRFFGPDPALAYFLNALVGTLTCWLAGRIALAIYSPRAQLLATGIAALTPSHVLFASLVLSETVFTAIMAALVLRAVTLARQTSASFVPWTSWFVWGGAVGLASLVRAEAVVLLAPPLAALVLTRMRLATVATIAAVAVSGIIAAESPWLARNAALFGRLVPVSTSFGRTFLIGHNPVAEGDMNDWSPDAAADQRDLMAGGPARELAVDERLRDAGIRFLLDNPEREAVLVVRRFYAMFRGDRIWGEWYFPGDPSPVSPAARERLGQLSNAWYWLLLLLAAPAFVRCFAGAERGRLIVGLTMVAWTAFFVLVFYGTQRFHFPMLPLFCVLAADTVCRLGSRHRSAA